MDLACPACKGSDVRRVSLVFKQGTSALELSTSSVGIGVGGGHVGIGIGDSSTSGSQQTLLARELAPPRKAEFGIAALLLVVGIIVLVTGGSAGGTPTAVGVGAVLLLVGGLLAKRANDFNTKEHPTLLATWERSFLCLRCGTRFETSVDN